MDEEEYREDLAIVIESQPCFDEDDLYIEKEYVYVNGNRIDSNGCHILAILEYLGFNVTVDYY